jgi:excisionase family DNA binding protein
MASAALDRAPIVAPASERKALGEFVVALGQLKPGRALLVAADGRRMILPHSLYVVLRKVVRQLAEGNGISVMPVRAKLTTQQAADLLNVSRPYLVRLLEERTIPFHMVGTHRRVYLKDLLDFQAKQDAASRETLRELNEEAQEMGIYDE